MTSEEQAVTAPRESLRDPSGLFGWQRGALIAYAVVAVAATASSAAYLNSGGANADFYPESDFELALTLGTAGTALFSTLIFIICAVLTARVTYRMMRNLHQIESPHVTTGPFWSVGWYFIPFANLVMPVAAVGQIWRGTFAAVEGEPPREPGGHIGWWWGSWITGNILDSVASRLSGSRLLQEPIAPTLEALNAALVLWALSCACHVGACVFMIRLFGTLARKQSSLTQIAAFP
jgi:hypothetical protein